MKKQWSGYEMIHNGLLDWKETLEEKEYPDLAGHVVPYSVMCIRNEEETIRGAAKMASHFAENVWFIIDPLTTDNTEKILREEFPHVNTTHQIRELGENDKFDTLYKDEFVGSTDESFKGHVEMGEGSLVQHYNMEFWINEIVPVGEWFFFSAADERFAPKDWVDVDCWVRFARRHGYTSLNLYSHLFIKPKDEPWDPIRGNQCIDFHYTGKISTHFIKNPTDGFFKGKPAHTGYYMGPRDKLFRIHANYYHFAYAKDSRIPFSGPRDHIPFKYYPRYQWVNSMGDGWRDLPNIDIHGNFKEVEK